VNRGPLTYSLRIGERWEKKGGTEEWPGFEVYPSTPWNYGLIQEPNGMVGEVEPGPVRK
jgi:hypothetical protein